jgi:hypothetical protein
LVVIVGEHDVEELAAPDLDVTAIVIVGCDHIRLRRTATRHQHQPAQKRKGRPTHGPDRPL